VSESLGFTHTLPGDGQTVSVKLTLSQSRLSIESGGAYAYNLPARAASYQSLLQDASYPEFDLKVDYKTTLPNKAKLTLGYEGTFDWQNQNEQGVSGPFAALVQPDPAFAQNFIFDQQTHAIYVTYEQVLGNLTVQPGLRLETTALQTDLVSTAQRGQQSYFEPNPSLHLDYKLTDESDIRASYGRRIQRPDESQLDPFAVEQVGNLYFAGNQNLKPAVTQSYELGYEYRKNTNDLQATLFYRDIP
jgi:outer membrane receptor protein involved in Fe transport